MSKRQWALCTHHLKAPALFENHEDMVKVELALSLYERHINDMRIATKRE